MKLLEGKYDAVSGVLVDAVWIAIKKSKEIYDSTNHDLYATKTIKTEDFKFQVIIKREKDFGAYKLDANTYHNKIVISLVIDPDIEPSIYSELNLDLQGTARHELEHILQEKGVPEKAKFPSSYMLKKINRDDYEYLIADHETEAMVKGFYRQAKNKKENLDVAIDDFLKYFLGDERITKKEAKEIKDKWINYAKKHLPNALYKKINGERHLHVRENLNEYIDQFKFKKWFGNSKIVDEKGNPLIVYHGTKAHFDKFKVGKTVGNNGEKDQIEGIYFTDNKSAALFFAAIEDDPSYLKTVYLSIQNPYITEGVKSLKESLKLDKLGDVAKKLKFMGYDGLIMEKGFYAYGGPHKQIIAFYPNQIKSTEFIKESQNFTRGLDPKAAMNIGITPKIKEWLDKHNIKNYTINDDLTIDVNDNVDFRTVSPSLKFSEFPSYIQFKHVSGYFTIVAVGITSLKGCPETVSRQFCCNKNYLTSLEYCPKKVGSDFSCYENTENFTEKYVRSLCEVKGKIEIFP
ncbi:MAG: hypothetical protein WC554_18190 [Clostridia bacterium]